MKFKLFFLQTRVIFFSLSLMYSFSLYGNSEKRSNQFNPSSNFHFNNSAPDYLIAFPADDFSGEEIQSSFFSNTGSDTELRSGIIPDGESIQGVSIGNDIFILLFFVALYILFRFYKRLNKRFFRNKQFFLLLLCLAGVTKGQYIQAQEVESGIVYADSYALLLNSSTRTLVASGGITGMNERTEYFGSFSTGSGNLYYTPKGGSLNAGVDFCTTSNGMKVAVVVFSPGNAYVGYEMNDTDDNIFNLANAMDPIKRLPKNWRVEYPGFYAVVSNSYSYNTPTPSGISLSYYAGAKKVRIVELYVDNQFKKEAIYNNGNTAPQVFVHSVIDNNRYYTIVDKRPNRGESVNKKLVFPANKGTITLRENYSNSANYGRFFLEGGALYYESNPASAGYGMDMQAFSINNVVNLAYGITVAPIDQAAKENGWAHLKCEDIIKGLPRNYSIRYTYWKGQDGSGPIPNFEGNLLEAAVFNIPLDGPVLQPGQQGHPGGSGSYRSQTYWVKAELYHNVGENGRIYRATSDPLPLFCYESKHPAWLSKMNYDNNLIEIVFENSTFSVCPENAISNLTAYPVELDLEFKVMAYKMKEEDGALVRDYDIPGFDMTSICDFFGFYDENENYELLLSGNGNYPYHRYKVGSQKDEYGFPHKGVSGSVFHSSPKSYGTKKDDKTMALYIRSEIDPRILWGSEASGMSSIVLSAKEGEVLIGLGICGESNDVFQTKTTSLIYRQDFGGYNESSTLYFRPNYYWDESFIPANIKEAIASSTYIYRNFERDRSEEYNGPMENKGLPYLDEGEYILTKQTEMHFNEYVPSSTNMWTPFHDDHTTPNNKNDGYMMQVNAGVEKGTFFDHKMFGLCKGATMTFTAWIKNTVVNSRVKDPVDHLFEIYDLRTNKLISRYRTGPILNPGNVNSSGGNINDWKQYGFEFTMPISTDSIRLKILNEGRGSNGNDFAIDDIEIRLLSKTKIEIKKPELPDQCQEEEIEVSVSVRDNDKKFYAWLYSPTCEMTGEAQWLELAAGEIGENDMASDVRLVINPHDYTIDKSKYPDYPTGYYRFAIGFSPDFMEGSCYDISDPVFYKSFEFGNAYLWTGQKNDGKWNNNGNWMRFYPDGSKAPEATQNSSDYPTYCNDVYIPGKGITYYPVVKDNDACHNIYFFQGGQIQNPQKLSYKRAFVDYNFGRVDAFSSCVSENKTPMQLAYSAAPNNRGQWYTIASPLKQILAGDFGFAGKPHTWQMKFLALKNAEDGINYGQWSGTFNNADIELAVNHNAMALLVGSFVNNYTGLNDHGNLESTDGVMRFPFFSDSHSPYYKSHPLHNYNLLTDISTFYRYQMENLRPIYNDPMLFKREREKGYRFVFEDNNDIYLPSYTYSVPAGKDVLIGNPFTSQLDMEKFLADNEDVLISPVYYDFVGSYISEAEQAFTYYVKSGSPVSIPGLNQASRYIPPLKSFVISTKNGSNHVTIKFSYDQTVVTQNRADFSMIRNDGMPGADILYLALEGESGTSFLTLSFEEKSAGNAGLLRMKNSKVPSIYAIDPLNESPNMVQFEGGYSRKRVPLGVLGFNEKEQLTIKAFHTEMLNVKSIFLIDNLLDEEIDLKTTSCYTFTGLTGISNRFELRVVPDNQSGIANHLPSSVIINSFGSSVRIVSTHSPIKSVEIFDLLGRSIVKDVDLNDETATYQLSRSYNTVIVKTLTEDNVSKVQKVVLAHPK